MQLEKIPLALRLEWQKALANFQIKTPAKTPSQPKDLF
jgi:hypothetical protein